VNPDLTVLGKAIAAGFPLSAVRGLGEWMEPVVNGRVAHVGTAIETLEATASHAYALLAKYTEHLARVFHEEAESHGLPLQENATTGVAPAFFASEPVDSYARACPSDRESYRQFAFHLLGQGVHMIPRRLLCVSVAHGQQQLEDAREAVRQACVALAARTVQRV
jgi:glutamate-1-semialdehyde 2,1-aminomutase